MLKIVRVGRPGPFVVELSLCIRIILVEGISLRIKDGYRIFELCGGLISLRATASRTWRCLPQDCCAACIVRIREPTGPRRGFSEAFEKQGLGDNDDAARTGE